MIAMNARLGFGIGEVNEELDEKEEKQQVHYSLPFP
jgi:hypothetical protein